MSATPVRVTVQLFARAREACGVGSVDLELVSGAAVSDCLAQMARQHPRLAGMATGLLVAVNERYASRRDVLRDGDHVALIPPVSGG